MLPQSVNRVGVPLVTVAVAAANVVKDIRENIKNLVGGRMHLYERLVEDTVNRVLPQLKRNA